MKRIVLDTNVLVSFLTDRDADQQAEASALFEAAALGEIQLLLHQMVISELVYVLKNIYGIETPEIAAVLDDLLASRGIQPINGLSWTLVLKLWPARVPDFADAALAAVTLEGRYDSLATFDQRFARCLHRESIESYWPSKQG